MAMPVGSPTIQPYTPPTPTAPTAPPSAPAAPAGPARTEGPQTRPVQSETTAEAVQGAKANLADAIRSGPPASEAKPAPGPGEKPAEGKPFGKEIWSVYTGDNGDDTYLWNNPVVNIKRPGPGAGEAKPAGGPVEPGTIK